MRFVYLVIIYILLFGIVACGSGEADRSRRTELYNEQKMSMHKYKADLYLSEIRKTAQIMADADRTHTGAINGLVKYMVDLERERQQSLYQMRQYQRRIEEDGQRY